MSRRAQDCSTDGLSAVTTGRPGGARRQPGGARRQLVGAFALLAVLAAASAGVFVERGTEALGTAPAPSFVSAPVRVTRSPVRAVLPRLIPVAKSAVQFEHRRAPVPRPTTTTTSTTVPVTAPPTTAPPVVARVDVPPESYPTSGALCAQAVAAVSWPPGWTVTCEGPRAGLLGLTNRQGTQLFMRSGSSASFDVMVAAHEAGHAWDFARLSPSDIATWCGARGCDAAHFFDGPGGPGWSEPGGAEDWAESWRICHGGTDMRNYLGLGPPSPELCALQLRLVAN